MRVARYWRNKRLRYRMIRKPATVERGQAVLRRERAIAPRRESQMPAKVA